MKATDYIARTLADKGVRFVFELTGGMITHLLDSLAGEDRIRIISCHHEQSAAFAAEGAARLTGVPGVALATSGPGATNLLTGIGSCYFDSVPAVFITGQVNTTELRPRQDMRQSGFQEADIVAMAGPLTKAAWQIGAGDDVPKALDKAFAIACSDRPGPVLIDIPMDVQRADIRPHALGLECLGAPARGRSDSMGEGVVRKTLAAMAVARRPLILAGGGVRTAGAASLFRAFSKSAGVPVVTSLMGLDVLPFNDSLRVGMVGSYGNRWANLALGRSDFLLVLGSRLDVRQTGADIAAFARGKTIVRVDVDAAQLGSPLKEDIAVRADLAAFLSAADDASSLVMAITKDGGWLREIDALRAQWRDVAEYEGVRGINPARLMHEISRASARAGAYMVDVGQNQMWAAQSVELGADQRFITSGGMGAMGFALPAAIGAALALAPQAVVVIAGDGGFQVNLQELETVSRLGLPLKIVVINNECLGMVRQFQKEYFEAKYQSTVTGYGTPDLATVAAAFGIAARTIGDESGVTEALEWLWREPTEPALLQVHLQQSLCVSPKVAFGNATHVMSPPERAMT